MQHSRFAYVLLAIFTGIFGIHNFYAGYKTRAISQLLISLLSLGCLALFVWIWAIIEACIVKQDAAGVPFLSGGTKSRLTYIVLALWLGITGMHNFYAGRTGKAIAQLLITLLSLGYLSFFVFIWVAVEICTETKDAQGVDFTN